MASLYVLTDISGTSLGRVENAHERKQTLQLNGLSTASFRIGLNNPMASQITSRSGDVLLKVYRGSTLTFIGDCISAEEVAEDGPPSLVCNFASPLWRLSKRLIGTSTTGEGDATYATTGAGRGAILQYLLDTTNTVHDTGIRVGTIASLRTDTAGPWVFKPISEVFTEMAASFAPPPFESVTAPYQAYDNFTAAPGTSFLNGRLADDGVHTWDDSGYGASGGFVEDGTGDNLGRSTVSDSSGGRYAFLGPSLTNCVVQCFVDRDGTMGTPATSLGIAARGTDQNNVLVLYIWTDLYPGHQQFALVKYVAGVRTVLWTSNFGNIIFTGMGGGYLRLTVDDTGRWGAWWWPRSDTSYQATPIATGQDDDLATGGALASGKAGVHDGNGTASAANRVWDEFFVDVPATSALDPQALDFELVPSEPTVDGSGLKIATLNVAQRIGTDRPSVIFEYGGGSRTIKSYRHAFSRDALMTKGYVLPQDATPWPSNALIEVSDSDAITARGFYEEVIPSDAGAMSRAVADLHLYFRKQAREEITFDLASNAPVFGTDYFIGDTVTARGLFNNSALFNDLFRIYGVDISDDDEGKETVTPTLART